VAVLAQSEDYSFFIKALLDLAQNHPTNADFYLNQAIKIQGEFNQFCQDTQQGGYYNNAHDNSNDLLIREKSYIDNATPSPNGVAIANLVRLHRFTDKQEYLVEAEKTLKLFSEIMNKANTSCPSLFTALNWYLNRTSVKTTEDIKSQLTQKYLPNIVIRLTENLPTNSIGIVCRGMSCFDPAISIKQLWNQLIINN